MFYLTQLHEEDLTKNSQFADEKKFPNKVTQLKSSKAGAWNMDSDSTIPSPRIIFSSSFETQADDASYTPYL